MSSPRSRGASPTAEGFALVWWAALILGMAPWSWAEPPDSGERARFTDSAAGSGLDAFVLISGGPEKRHILEGMSGGVALFDYDRDGDLDIYLVNGGRMVNGALVGARSALFRNEDGDTYVDVTDRAGVPNRGWGMGVCVADYDNDGHDDLYVTNAFSPNVLYRNLGDGRFEEVTQEAGVAGDGRWSAGCAFGDYDRDGDVDLAVTGYVHLDVTRLHEPPPTCQFLGVPVFCGPQGLDGAGDLLFRNGGDGTFQEVGEETGVADEARHYGLGVLWSDFDADGWPDLYVANDTTPNYLYRNRGDGTFEELGLLSGAGLSADGREQAGMGVAAGDFDGDGRTDLYVTNFSHDTNSLYRNDGHLVFTDVATELGHGSATLPYLGWGTAFLDYDNDARLEVFVANGHLFPQVDRHALNTAYHQHDLLFERAAGNGFHGVPIEHLPRRSSRGSAVGDLDDDGWLDVLVSNLDDRPTLLRNSGNGSGRWVRVALTGICSNRNALGARLRVASGDRTQVREVRSGSSYLSHDERISHFGLGTDQGVDHLEVRWPSGAVQRIESLEVNKKVVLEEPETCRVGSEL